MSEKPPKVIVCDDSPTIRQLILRALGPAYRCAEAASGEEALAKALELGPDLIISDLMMEGMDGYELCRRVRAEPSLRNVPLILLTSKSGDEARATGLEAGADDYLFKPIRKRELCARVGSLLALRRTTLNLERRTRELTDANRLLTEVQRALVQQEKLASLGQLVAGIAHELNNPLNFSYGNIGFLRSYAKTLVGFVERFDALALAAEEEAQVAAWKREADLKFILPDMLRVIDAVELGLRRATEVVRNLSAFARMGGKELCRTDLVATVEMALGVTAHERKDRIQVRKEYAPIPEVLCDGAQLSQVFVNLLINAAHAIAGTGEVVVSLREDGGLVRCAVRDNGSGMTPEVKARIFDPFFTTKPVGKGTGLGLSISYGIVEQHGGRIEVESEVGTGSTFTVVLPVDGPGQGMVKLP